MNRAFPPGPPPPRPPYGAPSPPIVPPPLLFAPGGNFVPPPPPPPNFGAPPAFLPPQSTLPPPPFASPFPFSSAPCLPTPPSHPIQPCLYPFHPNAHLTPSREQQKRHTVRVSTSYEAERWDSERREQGNEVAKSDERKAGKRERRHGESVDEQKRAKKQGDATDRDLAVSKMVLSKLGCSLPGNSRAEIERWVAERKRNWPSRRNVERKEAERREREGGGMGLLTAYASSEEDDEGRRGKENVRGKRGRGRGVRKGRRRGKGKVKEVKVDRGNLLKMLLQDEIDREANVLLQAIGHIVAKNGWRDE